MGDDFLEPLDQNFEGYLSLALFSNRFFEKGDALVVTTKTTTRMHSDLKLRIPFGNCRVNSRSILCSYCWGYV
jgi:hypothetical protein